MKIWEKRNGEIVILAVHGRFDAATSPIFEQTVQPMIARGEKNFLLDFTHLEYISSAALRRMLVLGQAASKTGGKVVLHSVRGNILEIMELAGFTQLFPIYSSQEEAIQAF